MQNPIRNIPGGPARDWPGKYPVKTAFLLLVFFSLLLAGCLKVPEKHQILGYDRGSGIVNDDSSCRVLPARGENEPGGTEMLDPRRFSLMNWNSYKGKGRRWQDDLERLISGGDIVTLQEGYLTDQLQNELQQQQLFWDIAAAFLFREIPTGVLTASRVEPDFLCSFRVKEPLIGIPKSVLITRYPLAGTDQTLLLANVHMVNLSFDISAYRHQLEQTAAILSQHQGPVILSGDFNSWSEERTALLESITDALHLRAVEFHDDNRALFFGRPVDYVFYRGLVPQATSADEVTTSDHNPMRVTFRLSGEQYRAAHNPVRESRNPPGMSLAAISAK